MELIGAKSKSINRRLELNAAPVSMNISLYAKGRKKKDQGKKKRARTKYMIILL